MVSASWGLNVIRTVWLGLSFLVILAGAASFRLAFGHLEAANASSIVRPDDRRTVVTDTNADRLRAWQIYSAIATSDNAEQAKAGSFASTGWMVEPSSSQDWHEPVSPMVRKTRSERPKRKAKRSREIADKSRAPEQTKPCQLADFDAFRWALGLPTGCHIQQPSKAIP